VGVTSRRAALAAMVGVLLAGGAAAQTRTVSLEPKKFFQYLDIYYRIPAQDRSRFTLAYYVKPTSAKFRIGGQPLPVGPDGRVRLPSEAMLKSKQPLVIEAPAGTKISADGGLEPTLRPDTEVNARELAAAVAQANQGIKRAAGLIRFVVPTLDAVVFPGAGSGEVVLADGRRARLPVVEGAPAFQPLAWPTAQRVVLARTPARMQLDGMPKPKKKR
jgi:hypothetical protein